MRGYEYSDTYYQLIDSGKIAIQETGSEENSLKMLAKGRVDTAILVYNETKPAEAIIRQAGVSGEVEFSFKSMTLELHIGFSKAHAQGALALAKYEQGIAKIMVDGTYDRITKRWVEMANSR